MKFEEFKKKIKKDKVYRWEVHEDRYFWVDTELGTTSLQSDDLKKLCFIDMEDFQLNNISFNVTTQIMYNDIRTWVQLEYENKH